MRDKKQKVNFKILDCNSLPCRFGSYWSSHCRLLNFYIQVFLHNVLFYIWRCIFDLVFQMRCTSSYCLRADAKVLFFPIAAKMSVFSLCLLQAKLYTVSGPNTESIQVCQLHITVFYCVQISVRTVLSLVCIKEYKLIKKWLIVRPNKFPSLWQIFWRDNEFSYTARNCDAFDIFPRLA